MNTPCSKDTTNQRKSMVFPFRNDQEISGWPTWDTLQTIQERIHPDASWSNDPSIINHQFGPKQGEGLTHIWLEIRDNIWWIWIVHIFGRLPQLSKADKNVQGAETATPLMTAGVTPRDKVKTCWNRRLPSCKPSWSASNKVSPVPNLNKPRWPQRW